MLALMSNVGVAEGGLLSSTESEGISYPSYNVFTDTSKQGTQDAIDDQLQDIEGRGATPSYQDYIDFSMFERFNVLFDGKNGLKAFQENMVSLQVPVIVSQSWERNYIFSEWTFGLWFNIKGTLPWVQGGHDQSLIEFQIIQEDINDTPPSFICDIETNGLLQCFKRLSNLQRINVISINLIQFGVQQDNWYFFEFDTKDIYHRLQLWDKSWTQNKKELIISQNPISLANSQIYLGLGSTLTLEQRFGEGDFGFKGFLKHAVLFSKQFQIDQEIKNIAFQYLHPMADIDLVMELPLNNNKSYSGLFEQVNQFNFELFGYYQNKDGSSLLQQKDHSPNWNCFHPSQEDMSTLFRFQGPETELQNITLQNYFDRSDSRGSYQTTLKMWIYREHLSSTKGEISILEDGSISGRTENPNEPNSWDEILFEHDGIMTLAFWKNSSEFLSFYNFDDISGGRLIQVQVPRGQWIWIQAEHSDSYFGIEVQNQQQRVFKSGGETVNHAEPSFKTNAKYIKIAPHFYGYIKGMKYFRNLQIQKTPEYFQEASSNNASLLLFFKFDRDNFNKDSFEFENLIENDRFDYQPALFNDTITEINPQDITQFVVRRRVPQVIFDRITFKQLFVNMQSGFKGSNIEWNGVSCSSSKMNLLFDSSTQSLALNFTNQNSQNGETNSLFLQTWIKLELKPRGQFTEGTEERLIQVKSMDQVTDQDDHLAIVVRDRSLWCVLYKNGELKQTFEYREFNPLRNEWMHITCHFKGIDQQGSEDPLLSFVNYNLLLGTLYLLDSKIENTYYNDEGQYNSAENFIMLRNDLMIEDDQFLLQINGPGKAQKNDQSSQGGGQIIVSPVREWLIQDLKITTRILSRQELYIQRHQSMLDLESDEDILVYAPLTEGIHYPYKFYNFKTGKSFEIESDNGSFKKLPSSDQSSHSPIVCPTNTVYNYADRNCILNDFIQQAQNLDHIIHVMKGRGTSFNISAEPVIFNKPDKHYYRSISDTILKYDFQIQGLSQKQQTDLIDSQGFNKLISLDIEHFNSLNQGDFKIDDESGTIQLDYQLDIKSRPGMLTQMEPLPTISTTTRINQCGAFFEKESELTFIEQSIPYEKGSQSLVLEFSGTDCEDFYFPYSNPDAFRVEIFYSEREKFKINTFEREGLKITIPKSIVSFMQVDTFFFVVVTATFQDKQETYYQDLSVIFKLRWAEQIIFDLQGSYGIAYESSLFIDASDARIINDDGDEDKYVMSYTWYCPQELDCTSIEKNQATFSISNYQSRQIGVDYLKRSQFILQIKSGYAMQNDLVYYAKAFDVTWIGPPRDININFKENYPISQYVELDISLRNENGEDQYWFDQVSIEWSVEGISGDTRQLANNIDRNTAFINGYTSYVFIVDKYVLSIPGRYRVIMRLFATGFENIQVYDEVMLINIVDGPQDGSLSIDLDQGENALKYNFTITAPGWTGEPFENGFLKYQYFYRDEIGDLVALSEQSYNMVQIKTLLPPTDLIQVQVTDGFNGTSEADLEVRIRIEETEIDYNIFIEKTDLLRNEVLQQIAANDTEGGVQSFKALALWASSMKKLSEGSSSEQLSTMQCSVLNVLSDNIQMINQSEPEAQKFMTQSSLIQIKQVMELQPLQSIKSECITKNLLVLGKLFEDEQLLQDELEQGRFNLATGLQMFSKIYSDAISSSQQFSIFNDEDETKLQSKELNQTEGNTELFRECISKFEAIVGKSILEGQKFTEVADGIQATFQKYAKTVENKENFVFRSNNGGVEGIFPLANASQPSDSFTMVSMIFNTDLGDLVGETAETGPFLGKTSRYQKIRSNDTLYLSFRGIDGKYIDAEKAFPDISSKGQESDPQQSPQIEINFKVNLTESVKQIFYKRQQSSLKCAYIGIYENNFTQFETQNCTTYLLDQNLEIIEQSSENSAKLSSENSTEPTNTNDGSAQSQNADPLASDEYVQILGMDHIIVNCLCHHMSYYLVVEDNTPVDQIDNDNFDKKLAETDEAKSTVLEHLQESDLQINYVVVLIVLYVVLISIIGLFYARAKDIEDFWLLTQTDEGVEDIPEVELPQKEKLSSQQNIVKRVSLITWIFHRKLLIEPYSLQMTKNKSAAISKISLSTWVVFKMFLSHLHPLFSISNHFDLTLKRIDRVIPLILRIVVLIPLCFFGLKDLKFEDFQNVNFLSEKELMIKVIVVTSVSVVLLLPLPLFLFSSCKMNFNLEHQILSLADFYQIENNNTNTLETLDQEQTSRPLGVKNKENPLRIDSQWSIKSLMLIQITPFSALLADPKLLKTKLSQVEFQKKIIEKQEALNAGSNFEKNGEILKNYQGNGGNQNEFQAKQGSSENIGILTQSADIADLSFDQNQNDKTEGRILGPENQDQKQILVRESKNANLEHNLKKKNKAQNIYNEQNMRESKLRESIIFKNGKEKTQPKQNIGQDSDDVPQMQNFDDNDEVLAGSVLSDKMDSGQQEESKERNAMTSVDNLSQVNKTKQVNENPNYERVQGVQLEGGDRSEIEDTKRSKFGDIDNLSIHNEIVQSIDVESPQNFGLNSINRPQNAGNKQPSRYQTNQYESGSSMNSNLPHNSPKSPHKFASQGQQMKKQRNINSFQGLKPSSNRSPKTNGLGQKFSASKKDRDPNNLDTLEEDVIKENFQEEDHSDGSPANLTEVKLDFIKDDLIVLEDGTLIVQDSTGQNNHGQMEGLFQQDQFGNIVHIEDVDPDLIENPNFDFLNGQKQCFVDERKQLVLKSNLTGQIIARAIQLLVGGVIMVLWLVSYSLSAEFQDSQSALFFIASYFGIQLFSFFVLCPLLLMVHAFLFACGCYQILLCGCQDKIFPLSQMLVTYLKEQSQQILQIKNKNNSV